MYKFFFFWFRSIYIPGCRSKIKTGRSELQLREAYMRGGHVQYKLGPPLLQYIGKV